MGREERGGSSPSLSKSTSASSSLSSSFSLLLSGLDLVDGTPILDIKPYVPQYDCVGYNDDVTRRRRRADDLCDDDNGHDGYDVGRPLSDAGADREGGGIGGGVDDRSGGGGGAFTRGGGARVPHWVESGLRKRRDVSIHPDASRFLRDLLIASTDTATDATIDDREDDANERAVDGVELKSGSRGGVGDSSSLHDPSSSSSTLSRMRFYGPHTPWKDDPRDAARYIENCIIETLEADVRSTWQTGKARGG